MMNVSVIDDRKHSQLYCILLLLLVHIDDIEYTAFQLPSHIVSLMFFVNMDEYEQTVVIVFHDICRTYSHRPTRGPGLGTILIAWQD